MVAHGPNVDAGNPMGSVALGLIARGVLVLAVGTAVYALVRSPDGHHLPGGLSLAIWPWLTGSLPSAAHVAGCALVTAGMLGPTRRTLVGAVLVWIVIGVGFEALQHPAVAAALVPEPGRTTGSGAPGILGRLLASHAHLGTFDPHDLIATGLGGGVAFFAAGALRRTRRSP